MHLKININFLEKYLANFVNDIEYKRITKIGNDGNCYFSLIEPSFIDKSGLKPGVDITNPVLPAADNLGDRDETGALVGGLK